MQIHLSRTGAERPVAAPRAVPRAIEDLPDVHGAFSIEDFPNQKDLKYTHDDAEGFLDYLENWHAKNFWYQDGGVQTWAYGEAYDNWQDTYGIDAVLCAYTSSHGGMGGDGNFSVCMGSDWYNTGLNAFSWDMRIGNEQANYVWWSTCQSIRIFGGHDPIRTWSPASQGFRMMFGYETNSVDSDDYGEDFWDEWNEGKSLSTAFLDASWGIDTDQIPVVFAVGATQAEAQNRLFNERYLEWPHVADNWFWWRWYEKANPARREPNTRLPEQPLIAVLTRRVVDTDYVEGVLRRHRLEMELPREVTANLRGTFHFGDGARRIAFRRDGTYAIEQAKPNLANRQPLGEDRAVQLAERYITEHALGEGLELTFDFIRYGKLAAGEKSGRQRIEPFVGETTVEFTQVVNGVPVVSPKAGRLLVTLDNDATVTRIENRTRPIAGLTRRSKRTHPGPRDELRMRDLEVYRRYLSQAWDRRRRMDDAIGKPSSTITLLPRTDEIGYIVDGDEMGLYAKGLIEIASEGGFAKRYRVAAPIVR
jgi:hypothetical protein